ncbi:MAG: extracellular solute-binding protein [Alphaproteobacteria bacterium]|nr:extracellular solute-binding protein [Alphaproteobacteria bacterium]MBU1562851.1 extracellular solute-binding protein [Alphaproteobacteria bacterium]MBU2302163.1 extracellular solute-binding protein [Alphaproteobacteria bacterium]MBU2368171.1 extracellular solute-binding protein [Alphaproteobacteria bacterium]
MPTKSFSIQRRIVTLALALLLTAAVVLIVFIRDYAERASDRAFDRLLAASALTIAGAVQVEDDTVIVELPFASFGMFSGQDRVFYAVEDPSGRAVTGYEDLSANLPEMNSAGPVFIDTSYRGELVRVASVGRLTSSGSDTDWVTIHVAETQNEREALSAEILGNAIVPVVALTLMGVALVWFGIGRMFAPLYQLERELRARAPDDLSPLDVPVPVEVSHLVSALNAFMARLGSAMDRVTGLVAEAAHEVRTPLASLRAQAEVAMDEQDPEALRRRVGRIHQGAIQASQLVSQLLMEATISHRLENQETDTTAFGAVVEDVRQRLDPDQARRLVVDLAEAVAAAPIRGDRVALREMVRNVVDNALVYSDGLVEIGGHVGEGMMTMSVSDRGPGIADAEKPLVLERFKRGAASGSKVGSGLGLSIVKRVAEAHRGALRLADRPDGGLVVEIDLPLVGRTRQVEQLRKALGSLSAVVLCLLLMAPQDARAASSTYPAPDGSTGTVLTIVGTTDTPLFADFVTGFQAVRPDVTVEYDEQDSLPMYENFLSGAMAPPDLLISSAADLQIKLANDGHAMAYDSPWLGGLPDWAHWRNEVFGFTFEPAVIIYNPDRITAAEVPRTHLTLAEMLETQSERFRGAIATYDIAESGVGYLLASQDQLISSNFWRLAAAFGRVDARFSGSSPAILNGVADGSLALGYNVLGSYAFARKAAGANIEIVVPDDYVLVLTRAMLIPREAPYPDLARAFVDFALSPVGQAIAAGPTALGSVVTGAKGDWTSEAIAARGRGVIQPIPLGPALLVSLDQQRRKRFLDSWGEIASPKP